MRYLFIGLIFLMLLNRGQAQIVPGYLGKTGFLEAGGALLFGNPVLVPPFDGSFEYLSIAGQFNLDYNYTLGRQVIVRAGWSHAFFLIDTYYDIYLQSYYSSSYFLHQEKRASYAVYANDLHVHFDCYFPNKRGRIAPLGSFFRMGLRTINTFRVLTDGSDGLTRLKESTAQMPYWLVGLDLALGYRTVIADQLLFSFNLGTTLTPQTLPVLLPEEQSILKHRQDITTDYRHQVGRQLGDRYLLSFALSLGVFLH